MVEKSWPEVATNTANDVLVSPTIFDNQSRNIVLTNYGDRPKIEDLCQRGSLNQIAINLMIQKDNLIRKCFHIVYFIKLLQYIIEYRKISRNK